MDRSNPPAARLAETLEIDAYAPAQIAERVERPGVAKARLPILQTFTLGVLPGAFIALGAMLFTLVTTDPGMGFGPARLLGGIAFSLGLVMVAIAGAELFTGNNLLVMAWVDGRIRLSELARNWAIVYPANLVGAVGMAVLVWAADGLMLGQGRVLETAASWASPTGSATAGSRARRVRGVDEGATFSWQLRRRGRERGSRDGGSGAGGGRVDGTGGAAATGDSARPGRPAPEARRRWSNRRGWRDPARRRAARHHRRGRRACRAALDHHTAARRRGRAHA